jgi:hypothetical protein
MYKYRHLVRCLVAHPEAPPTDEIQDVRPLLAEEAERLWENDRPGRRRPFFPTVCVLAVSSDEQIRPAGWYTG